MLGFSFILLFFPEINLDRNSTKIKMLTQLILYISFISILNILWKIGKKYKGWRIRWQLSTIFNLNIFPFLQLVVGNAQLMATSLHSTLKWQFSVFYFYEPELQFPILLTTFAFLRRIQIQ